MFYVLLFREQGKGGQSVVSPTSRKVLTKLAEADNSFMR